MLGGNNMSIPVAEDAGDDWAGVVELHDATLRRFIGRQTPDRAMVEDILQDTYLRAVRTGRHPRRTELTDEGWLRMLARRASVDAYRGAKRRATPVDYLAMVGEPLTADGTVTPGSDEHLDAMVSREAVRWAFQRLTPRQQRLLVLRGVDGLTYQEMAAAERTTVEAMASALNRARERLRAGIERYDNRGVRRLPAVALFAHDVLRRMRERFTRVQALFSPHLIELAGATMALGVAGVLTGVGSTPPVVAESVTVGSDAGRAVADGHVRRVAEGTLTEAAAAVAAPRPALPTTPEHTQVDAPRRLVEARPDLVLEGDRTSMQIDIETSTVTTSRTQGTVTWDCAASELAARACPILAQVPPVA
jgi:RNA polymerase sigma-70 factor (ECF subfamily)